MEMALVNSKVPSWPRGHPCCWEGSGPECQYQQSVMFEQINISDIYCGYTILVSLVPVTTSFRDQGIQPIWLKEYINTMGAEYMRTLHICMLACLPSNWRSTKKAVHWPPVGAGIWATQVREPWNHLESCFDFDLPMLKKTTWLCFFQDPGHPGNSKISTVTLQTPGLS